MTMQNNTTPNQAEIDEFMADCGFTKEVIDGKIWYDSDLQSFALHEAAFWFSIVKEREVAATINTIESYFGNYIKNGELSSDQFDIAMIGEELAKLKDKTHE